MMKALIHALFLVPFLWIVHNFFMYQLGSDPVDTLMKWSGFSALILLAWVAVGNFIKRIKRIRHLPSSIRYGGWYALTYTFIHLLIFMVLDFELNLPEIIEEIFKKQYILFGMGAFVLMGFMGYIHEARNKSLLKLRPLFYLIPLLGTLHYFFAQKVPTPFSITLLVIATLFIGVRLFLMLKMDKKPGIIG